VVTPLVGLNDDNDRQKLLDAIDNIGQSPVGLGWSRSNVAMLTAALMLDPAHKSAFGDGVAPGAFDANTNKIVILMTDGGNMGCCYAAHPEGNYDNQYLYLYDIDNAHLSGVDKAPAMKQWADKYKLPNEGLCDAMKNKGIVIYSVVLDVDERDPGGKAIKDIYKDCASNDQFFFDVKDEEELKLAYKTISNSLLRLRIVY